MAQAAQAVRTSVGNHRAWHLKGRLFRRWIEVLHLIAEQSRQREDLAGFTSTQEVGRETGARG